MVGNGQLESASQAVGAEWEKRDEGGGLKQRKQAVHNHNRAAAALHEWRRKKRTDWNQQAQMEMARLKMAVGSIADADAEAEARQRHARETPRAEWAVEPQTRYSSGLGLRGTASPIPPSAKFN